MVARISKSFRFLDKELQLMSIVTERGKRFYETCLKSTLEPQENGKFVAIEPESERYFIGDTALEAVKKGKEVFPNKIFFLVHIGFPAAYRIRRYGKELTLKQGTN